MAGIDATEGELTNQRKFWWDVSSTNEPYQTLELELNTQTGQNIDILLDTTSAGQNRDFISFDNSITLVDSIQIMENLDYEFNSLIDDDLKSPGIYGMKPRLISDLNQIDFSSEIEPAASPEDKTGIPDDVKDELFNNS